MEYVPCRSFLKQHSILSKINEKQPSGWPATTDRLLRRQQVLHLSRHNVLEIRHPDILGAFEGHLSSSQPEGLLQRAETFLKEILRGLGDKTLKTQSFSSILLLLLLLLSSICKIRLEAYYDAIKGVSSLMHRFLSRFHNYLGVALGHRKICRAFFGVKVCWGRVGLHPMGWFHFPCIFR